MQGEYESGFYRSDSLPANTALGYMGDVKNKDQRTNFFSIPIIGGSDGGIFTCARDLDTLWRAVFSNQILSTDMLKQFTARQIIRSRNESYGLGIYRYDSGSNTAFYAVGSDFGIDFFTAYFPKCEIVASSLGNTELTAYPLLEHII